LNLISLYDETLVVASFKKVYTFDSVNARYYHVIASRVFMTRTAGKANEIEKAVRTVFGNGDLYLDNASRVTPSQNVLDAFISVACLPGNPSSLHTQGRDQRQILQEARERFAKSMSVAKDTLVFTSGGTESVNSGVLGSYFAMKKKFGAVHLITSTIEHPAVKEIFQHLVEQGERVTWLPVNERGMLNPEIIMTLPHNEIPYLVSIIHAQSETGIIQPVRKIAQIIKSKNKDSVVHTDASQSPLWLNVSPDALGVDMLTLDANKFGGIAGCGVLYRNKNVPIEPIFFGGGQEKGLRSGTQNVAAIHASSIAFEKAVKGREERSINTQTTRDKLWQELQKIDGVELNGALENRLPNNLHICIKGIYAEGLVIQLDMAGIAISHVTSCASAHGNGSDVLRAMGKDECANSSFRITLS
jgi:cysteine desulfurase